MKKLLLSTMLLAGMSLGFAKGTPVNQTNGTETIIASEKKNNLNRELNINNLIEKQKQEFSRYFYSLGVFDIVKKNKTFYYLTHKNFFFNEEYHNLENFKFSYNNKSITLNKSSIIIENGERFLVDGGVKTNFKSIEKKHLNKIDNYVLYITYFELLGSDKFSYTTNEIMEMKSLPGCAWWNTLTITGIGRTKAAAMQDLWNATIQAANSGQLRGCRSIGGVEYDDFGMISNASQSFCCDRVFPHLSPQ